jgi:sporulation protein YabP
METKNNKPITSTNKHTTLEIKNQRQIRLDGVNEVKRTNNTEIVLKLDNKPLIIKGNNLNVTKIDLEEGLLIAEGIILSINYETKQNLLKKLFK